MKVAITSLFRTAGDGVDSYFARMCLLDTALKARGDSLRLILSEGDSVDATWERLLSNGRELGIETVLIHKDHGGPYFGSVVNPDRFWQLSFAANAAMDAITDDVDVWAFVERDLMWGMADMLKLFDRMAEVPAVCPVIIQNTWFYDTWAYRLDGEHFRALPPYHDGLRDPGQPPRSEMTRIDAAGSVIVMRGDLARVCRFQSEDCIVGLCRDIYKHGGSLWFDPTVIVRHPE